MLTGQQARRLRGNNLPYQYLSPTGIILADTSEVKAEVQSEFRAAFGPEILLADESPQGRLIDIETVTRDAFMRIMAEVANQINPNLSSGQFLESLCALHAVTPAIESRTLLVSVKLTGTPGAVVPQGSRIADADGNYYACTSTTTLDGTGEGSVDFGADKIGAFDPPDGTVTTIIDGVIGWESVRNGPTNIVGTLRLTDRDLRVARNARLSLLGKASVESLSSNILEVPGVRSVAIRENTESRVATIDGVRVDPHGVWICVQGGDQREIALAALRGKQIGAPWSRGSNNGIVITVDVTEPASQQNYRVIFTRPTPLNIEIRVIVATGSSIDATVAVPDAIFAYAEGRLPGERGFVLGANVSPFEIASAIDRQFPQLFIKRVEMRVSGSSDWSIDSAIVPLWQFAAISRGNILTLLE